VNLADNSMRMANMNVRLQVGQSAPQPETAIACMPACTLCMVRPWATNADSKIPAHKARLRGLGMGFFILCVILNVYVDYGSCISYLQAWRMSIHLRAPL
jgi:hypothetical protein